MPNPHPGQWDIVYNGGIPLDTEQTAVHANLIYNPSTGKWKVLYFRAFDPPPTTFSVETKIWDPKAASNPISTQQIPDWPSWSSPPDPPGLPADFKARLFCSGHCFLADGKLIVGGGHRYPVDNNIWARGMLFSYIFNPVNETWSYQGLPSNPVRMRDGRWYPTLTLLGEPAFTNRGKVVVSGGYRYNYDQFGQPYTLVFNNDMEIYNPDPLNPSWNYLGTNANNQFIANYPGVHVIPSGNFAGELFYSIPNTQSYRFKPEGPAPFWNSMASSSLFRGHGCSILLPLSGTSAKIMIIGGVFDGILPATNTCEIMNFNDRNPVWSGTGSLNYGRNNANAVILPDGKVLIVGGNSIDLYFEPVKMTEVYDPSTNLWTSLVEQNYARVYHSTAILLPDGRVWSAGGESTSGGSAYTNLEIYSPGYLFEGARPQFNTPPPSDISYGVNFGINTDVPIESVVIIKPGSTTHAFDQDQRSIKLTMSDPSINGGFGYTVTSPANGNIAPPGYYMLFVVKPKSESSSGQHNIPSIAKFVKLS